MRGRRERRATLRASPKRFQAVRSTAAHPQLWVLKLREFARQMVSNVAPVSVRLDTAGFPRRVVGVGDDHLRGAFIG